MPARSSWRTRQRMGSPDGKTLPRGILLLMVTVCVMKKIALHWPDGPFFNTQRSAHSYIREIGNACSFFLGPVELVRLCLVR